MVVWVTGTQKKIPALVQKQVSNIATFVAILQLAKQDSPTLCQFVLTKRWHYWLSCFFRIYSPSCLFKIEPKCSYVPVTHSILKEYYTTTKQLRISRTKNSEDLTKNNVK